MKRLGKLQRDSSRGLRRTWRDSNHNFTIKEEKGRRMKLKQSLNEILGVIVCGLVSLFLVNLTINRDRECMKMGPCSK